MRELNVSYSVFKDAATLSNVYYFNNGSSIFTSTKAGGFIFTVNITDASDIIDFNLNIQPTATEVFSEDDTVGKSAIETDLVAKFDLGDQFIYMGQAAPGSLSSQSEWKVSRYTFDINGDPTDEQVSDSNVIWDDRASLTYY